MRITQALKREVVLFQIVGRRFWTWRTSCDSDSSCPVGNTYKQGYPCACLCLR